MEKTHISVGILYFNLKWLKLTLQFLLHQKAQIPDSVFDLQEEICQCAWLCPGDTDILGQVAVVGLLVVGGWRGWRGWREDGACSSISVLPLRCLATSIKTCQESSAALVNVSSTCMLMVDVCHI